MSDLQDILNRTNSCLRHTEGVFSKLRDLGWKDGHSMPRTGEKLLVVDLIVLNTHATVAYYKARYFNGYFELMDDKDTVIQKSLRPPLFWRRVTFHE